MVEFEENKAELYIYIGAGTGAGRLPSAPVDTQGTHLETDEIL